MRFWLSPIRYLRQVISLFFLLTAPLIFGQSPSKADSLESLYLQGTFKTSDSLQILDQLITNFQDPSKLLEYSEVYIEVALRQDSTHRLFQGYLQKGNGYVRLGNQVDALENYFEAAKYAEDAKSEGTLGSVYVTIADVYSMMDNSENSRDYYRRAIDILRQTKDTLSLATGLANAGDFYYGEGKLDSALTYFQEAGMLFKALDYQLGIGYYLGSLGMIYSKQGKTEEALEYLNQCLDILEEEGDYYGVSAFLPFVSDIYREKRDYRSAIQYAKRSLSIATKYGLKEQIRDANLLLSELYEPLGDTDESLKYYKGYTAYKDSISNVGVVQQMARMRTEYEVDQKQAEVDLLEKEAEIRELSERRQETALYITIGALLVVFLFAFGLYRRFKFIQRTSNIISSEKSRSDALLRNILPEETAEELKAHGRVKAKKFDSVSVLFADFVGFTSYSEKMSPEDLVKTVDYYFSRFDQIVEKYKLEKIKTMGDCYMCAGGLPFPTQDHAVRMVHLALEFVQVLAEDGYSEVTGFEIRIGINSGPVVAGVVGTKKFAYDIWGDTVNIAARMESYSLPGEVNISENTYQLVKHHFDCEFRGMINVKNKGMMKMYFVKEALSTATKPFMEEIIEEDIIKG